MSSLLFGRNVPAATALTVHVASITRLEQNTVVVMVAERCYGLPGKVVMKVAGPRPLFTP